MSRTAFLTVSLLFSTCISRTRTHTGEISWDAFVAMISELADERTLTWDQAEYVSRVSQILQRLNMADPLILRALAATRDKLLISPEFNNLHTSATFELVSIVFEKGQRIGHHDQPDITGVLGCASGQLLARNYERLSAIEGESCLIEGVAVRRLHPGNVSSLTARAANIHEIRAEERTQVIDLFTPPYNDDRQRRTHWYAVEDQPVQAGTKVFRAFVV